MVISDDEFEELQRVFFIEQYGYPARPADRARFRPLIDKGWVVEDQHGVLRVPAQVQQDVVLAKRPLRKR